MHKVVRLFTPFVLLVAISACTWGELRPKAVNVELLSSADVAECMLLGTATGKAKSRWSASRTDMSAVNEARAMARREAVYIGGNVLVEKSALLNGRQTFSVYSCP